MKQANEYVPGTCNIEGEELRARKKFFLLMLIVSIAFIALVLLFDIPKFWRLMLFIPVSASALGLIQWRAKFCVFYGFKGLFSFEKMGDTVPVEIKEMVRLDKARARKLSILALLIGAVVSILFYFFP